MAYDHDLAARVRGCLEGEVGLAEKEMFGGLAFMLDGNMGCGVMGNDLLVRVGPQRHDEIMKRAHVKPFDMTGRPMKGWVVVDSSGLENDGDLVSWVSQGVNFARTLPPK